jgi:hypothetical protein
MQPRARPVLPALQGTVRISSVSLKLHSALHFTNFQPDFCKFFASSASTSLLSVGKTVLSRLPFILEYYKIFQGFLLQYREKSLYSLIYEQSSSFIQNRLQHKGNPPEVSGRGYPHPQQLSCDHYSRPPQSQRHPLGSGRAVRGKRERKKRDSLL